MEPSASEQHMEVPPDTGSEPRPPVRYTSPKQLEHLARIRGKAAEARRRLKEQRLAAEAEAKAMLQAQIEANKQAAVQAVANPVRNTRTKAIARTVAANDTASSSDTDSDSSDNEVPVKRTSRATAGRGVGSEAPFRATDSDVARKLARMERELLKLKYKERYSKQASAPLQPIVVQVPEQRKAPSDAASLAREALALASYGNPAPAPAPAAAKPQRTMEFPGGYRPLF